MAHSSRLLSAAVLLAVLATTAAGAPYYCIPGKAIPAHPLTSCSWYVAGRTCGVAPLLPVSEMKKRWRRELGAVVPECRCKALRDMMMMGQGQEQQCWRKQVGFAATVVMEHEWNLLTIHGSNLCKALRDMTMMGQGQEQQCWRKQVGFTATVVTEHEWNLLTIHGSNLCKALRDMMMMGQGQEQQCWLKQVGFAATMVMEHECNLLTIHGSNFY